MTLDRRVEAPISLFLLRLITNGVPLADFQDATKGLGGWEDWCSRFADRAAIHDTLGRNASAQG